MYSTTFSLQMVGEWHAVCYWLYMYFGRKEKWLQSWTELNKEENHPSPQINDELTLQPKCAILSIIEMGGVVFFIYFVQDCRF